MSRTCVALSVGFSLLISESLAGPLAEFPTAEKEEDDVKWEFSLSTATILAQNSKDYVNPNFSADRDWLHLEARYQYEAIKSGSIWLGYNFSFGDKLSLEVTPMIGGVLGGITGVAPGYLISASYKSFEFLTQGEYFIDAAIHAGNFFYTWSELSYAPIEWFRFGVVVDRTKAIGSSTAIRRGPLVGVKYKNVDFTTYWLSPGAHEGVIIFSVTVSF